MTRKQALSIAIEQLKQFNQETELIVTLQQIQSDLPLAHWTKEMVFDAINQYIEDNKKLPNLADFVPENNLPSKTVVNRLFHKTLPAFLWAYYPNEKRHKIQDRIVYKGSEDELIRQFKEQCKKLGSTAMKYYNKHRDVSAPCSTTLLRRLNIKTWNELLQLAGFKINCYNDSSVVRKGPEEEKLLFTKLRQEPTEELKIIVREFFNKAKRRMENKL